MVTKWIQPAAKSEEEYTNDFQIKAEEVDKIFGEPTWRAIKKVRNALEENLIAMEDKRDNKYGKLHLIIDTSTLPNGPTGLNPQFSQDDKDARDVDITARNTVPLYKHEKCIPTWILELVNPGGRPAHEGETAKNRENTLIAWAEKKVLRLLDQAAEEACKKFLINCIGVLYFKPLKD